jgi:hypothetical protein
MIDAPVVGVPVREAHTVTAARRGGDGSLARARVVTVGPGDQRTDVSPFYSYEGRPVSPRPDFWSSLRWAIGSGAVVTFIVLAAVLRTPEATGIETVWLVPSLCPLPGSKLSEYVGFLSATAAVPQSGSGAEMAGPSLGSACPAKVHSMPQEFSLPRDLSWAAAGHNESLVIFRGEHDSVTLSYTLSDAKGAVLLEQRRVQLESLANSTFAAARRRHRRRLLFGGRTPLASVDGGVEMADGDLEMADGDGRSPTSRRLLKGSTVHSPSGLRSSYQVAGPHVSHSTVSKPWGGAVPSRTAYGLTSRRAIMAGAHRRRPRSRLA